MAAPRSVGEFEIIAAIEGLVRDRGAGRGVRLGIGDDAAVLATDSQSIVTTDALVEGVHFRRDWLSAAQLGCRAFRVASSDIAAMGATPKYVLLSLMIPAAYSRTDVRRCVAGLVDEAAQAKSALVGGNISSGPVLSLTLTVIGISGARIITRSGARPGDAVVVTGTLGDAAAGVELLTAGSRRGKLVDSYRQPPSRIALGARLARAADVSAMLDLSDGLGADLRHLCGSSQVSARVDTDKIPVSKALETHVRRKGTGGILDYAIRGEDYELLMAVGGGAAGLRRVARACKTDGVSMTVIGGIEPMGRAPCVVDVGGTELTGGWDHLSS
jgi:thiamine-monophosphate kinase